MDGWMTKAGDARRETERTRAVSGRVWLTLGRLAEQLDFISGWC